MSCGVPLGAVVSTDASNLGWGALYEGRPAFGSWSSKESHLYMNCLEMLAVCQALHSFLGPEGTLRLGPIGQHDSGILHESPGRAFIQMHLCTGKAALGMSSAQTVFAKSIAHTGQTEPRSRYAISEQCPLRRVVAPPPDGSQNLGDLQTSKLSGRCAGP